MKFYKSEAPVLVVLVGTAPTVLLLHGFPECWYSWRNQMSSLHNAGFHVIAIDLRGYGRSDCPESVEEYTTLHIVGDLIGLMDALSLKEVRMFPSCTSLLSSA